MATAIYDSSLVTRVLRYRTLYAFYVANKRLVDLGLSVQKLQNIPVSELVVLETRLGQQIEYRNGIPFIPFEFDIDYAAGGGSGPEPPAPLETDITLQFDSTSSSTLYFYYTGSLQYVDWGDGNIQEFNDPSPVSYTLVQHEYEGAPATYNVSIVANDLLGFWLYGSPTQEGVLSVDLSGANLLEELSVNYTSISSLASFGPSALLTTLKCAGTQLPSLDTTPFPSLEIIECGFQTLSSLNVAPSASLQDLDITGLTLSDTLIITNQQLNTLTANGATILSLNANNIPQLVQADVSGSANISTLVFNQCTGLINLLLNNPTMEICNLFGCSSLVGPVNVSNYASMTILNISGCTNLSSVLVSGCSSLDQLVATNSGITGLDLNGCDSLTSLLASNCPQLTQVQNIANNTSIATINLENATSLTSIDVNGCSALNTLNLSGSGLSSALSITTSPFLNSLNITGCVSLPSLVASGLGLSSFDFNGCTSLTSVNVSSNLALLSINNLTTATLTNLNISYTSVTSINTTPLTGLQTFNASFNTVFSSLVGISGNTSIETINVEACDLLTSIDISGCTALKFLNAAGSGVTNIDDILAQLAVNSTSVPGGNVDLRVNNDVEPSDPIGWAYVNTIRANGWILEVNGALPPPPSPESLAFTYTVDVTSAPLTTFFIYQGQLESVDWADGSGTVIGDTSITGSTIQHTYSTNGTYNILVNKLNSTVQPVLLLSFYNAVSVVAQPAITDFGATTDISNIGRLVTIGTGITQLDITELSGIQELLCENSSLTGIIGLADKTSLTTLNVISCTSLTTVDATGCAALSFLSIQNCSGLTNLICSGCAALPSVDFTGCSAISVVELDNCPILDTITTLNGKTTLTELIIANDTALTSLNINGCSGLTNLNATNSGLSGAINWTGLSALSTLDLTNCSAIISLQLVQTQLATINFTGCTGITGLLLNENSKLTFLQFNQLPNLQICSISDCSFGSIDLATNTSLSSLFLDNNTGLTELIGLTSKSLLATVNVASCSSLTSLDVSGCSSLLTLSVSNCSSLTSLIASTTQITSLDLDGCNVIATINVNDCASLSSIINGPLPVLPPSLIDINFERCTSLISLDINNCSNLQRLYGTDSALTDLTIVSCSSLTEIYLQGCALNENSVDAILLNSRDVKQNNPGTLGTAYLDLGTNATPSSTGLDDYGYLIDSPDPWDVLINGGGPPPPPPSVDPVISLGYNGDNSVYVIYSGDIAEIDWGDGNVTNISSGYVSDSRVSHIYSSVPSEMTITLKKLTTTTTQVLTSLSVYDGIVAQPGFTSNITPYDVSELTSLNYSYTNIDSIDVSTFSALTTLTVSSCGFLNIQIDSPTLTDLDLSYTASLFSQDLSIIPAIKNLNISFSAIQQLENSSSTLQDLVANNSALTSLDLSNCTTLEGLNVSNCSSLITVNISNCTALTSIIDASNVIVTLIANNSGLMTLNLAGYTALTTLNISNCASLTSLIGDAFTLQTINANNSALVGDIGFLGDGSTQYTGLTSLSFNNCVDISSINLYILPALTTITANNSTKLDVFYIDNVPILSNIQLNTCKLTTTSINNILGESITNYSNSGNTLIGNINVAGIGNAVPDATGQGLKSNLISFGWTVTTN
jgi:hypothetical protein